MPLGPNHALSCAWLRNFLLIQCQSCPAVEDKFCFDCFNSKTSLPDCLSGDYKTQGCQSSAFRRNSAFYFYFPLFSKLFSSFFLKNRTKKKKKNHYRHRHYRECSNSFGKQSVTSWFAGMCLLPFPVEVRKHRISTQWSKPCCVLAYSVG